MNDADYQWNSKDVDLDAYLARIGYEGGLEPVLETLQGLHWAHTQTIPFENLDIMLGRPISIDLHDIQNKLVRRSRGGYCFEHNLLFAAVLERLGFPITGYGARIRMGTTMLRPSGHIVLRADLDGEPWLADVGIGSEGLLEAIPLRDETEVAQGSWTFRLEHTERREWILRSRHPDGWFDVYTFTEEPQYRVDYMMRNHFTSTHPLSPFTTRVLVQQPGPSVRRVLAGTDLMVIRPGDGPKTRRLSPEELPGVLKDEFGIVLSAEESDRLAQPSCAPPT